jgi:hypothetical protein
VVSLLRYVDYGGPYVLAADYHVAAEYVEVISL